MLGVEAVYLEFSAFFKFAYVENLFREHISQATLVLWVSCLSNIQDAPKSTGLNISAHLE